MTAGAGGRGDGRGDGRGPGSRLAWTLLTWASRMVPPPRRSAWLDEWRGELWALEDRGRSGAALLAFALGGLRHAGWERREAWMRHVGERTRGLADDARSAVRRLTRAPGHAAVVVVVLGLGVGANVALFGALRAALLAPPPYPEPERLVVVDLLSLRDGEPPDTLPWSWPKYEAVRGEMGFLTDAAAFMPRNVTLERGTAGPARPGGGADRAWAELVDPSYFRLLGVEPAEGRLFLDHERPPEPARVMVLAHDTWVRRFGSDPAAIGAMVRVDGEPFEVVGVAERGFRGLGGTAEAWLPMSAAPVVMDARRLERVWAHWFGVVGRLANGVPPALARERAAALGAVLQERFTGPGGEVAPQSVALTPLLDVRVNPTARAAVGAVGAGALLLLLIAVANAAGLFLARTAALRGDLVVRAALGAGRRRLAREVIVESLLLAGVAGAAGIVLALAAQRGVRWGAAFALDTMGGRGVRFLDPEALGLDPFLLACGLALTLATGLVFGAAPARAAARAGESGGIRSAGRGGTPLGREPGGAARSILVTAQIALTLVLLTGAGLMLTSFQRLGSVAPGFDPDGVLAARFDLGPGSSGDEILAFEAGIVERLEGLPGVEAAAVGVCAPLLGPCDLTGVKQVDDRVEPEGADLDWMHTVPVSPGWFDVMGVEILRGRTLPVGLSAADPPVAVIDRTAAERYFPGRDPIGHRIALTHSATEGTTAEIVGVAENVVWAGLEEEPLPTLYFSSEQAPAGWGFVTLRAAGDPAALSDGLQQEVLALAPGRPAYEPTPLTRVHAAATARTRVILALLLAFAALALLLSAVGLYGLVAYAVSRRTREMGLRMALGAGRAGIMGAVALRPLLLTAVAAAIGVGAAPFLTTRMRALLFEVEPADPLVMGGACALLLVVGLAAALVPAHRATRIPPSEALRSE